MLPSGGGGGGEERRLRFPAFSGAQKPVNVGSGSEGAAFPPLLFLSNDLYCVFHSVSDLSEWNHSVLLLFHRCWCHIKIWIQSQGPDLNLQSLRMDWILPGEPTRSVTHLCMRRPPSCAIVNGHQWWRGPPPWLDTRMWRYLLQARLTGCISLSHLAKAELWPEGL